MGLLQWLTLAVLACSYMAEGYKILVVFPFPGKSHTILGEGVVRHLVNAGHEVRHTYITSRPFPIGIGREHFLSLALILTHTFRFFHFHQIPHTRAPVSENLDPALL
jgi:hypothetical protein